MIIHDITAKYILISIYKKEHKNNLFRLRKKKKKSFKMLIVLNILLSSFINIFKIFLGLGVIFLLFLILVIPLNKYLKKKQKISKSMIDPTTTRAFHWSRDTVVNHDEFINSSCRDGFEPIHREQQQFQQYDNLTQTTNIRNLSSNSSNINQYDENLRTASMVFHIFCTMFSKYYQYIHF